MESDQQEISPIGRAAATQSRAERNPEYWAQRDSMADAHAIAKQIIHYRTRTGLSQHPSGGVPEACGGVGSAAVYSHEQGFWHTAVLQLAWRYYNATSRPTGRGSRLTHPSQSASMHDNFIERPDDTTREPGATAYDRACPAKMPMIPM